MALITKIDIKKITAAKLVSRIDETWTSVNALGQTTTADHDGAKLKMIKDKLNEISDALLLVKLL